MRLIYIVTIDTDEEWVKRHPQYTPEFIRHQTECRISDSLRFELAYEKHDVKEQVAPPPAEQFLRVAGCAACENGEPFHDH